MCGIYMIINCVNDKKYIGQSVDVEDRLAHHKSMLKHNRHENSYLQNAYNKYGDMCFLFCIIEICDENNLDELEIKYISEYNTTNRQNGYNRETGGSLNKHMSDDAKLKMSIAKQGKYDGKNNPMYGIHLQHSEEWKRNMSERNKGKNNPCYGKKFGPESAEKREYKSKLFSAEGNPFYGCKHSEETKKKMRENNKKKKKVICVETGIEYESSCEAERQTKIDSSHINKCCNGKAHTAGRYHWKFVV